jgi:hypothetical protein
MKFAGQKDPDVFFGSYMPQVSDVDGQSGFWGGKRRAVHIEALRGLSLQYHPQMVQSLPAKVQDDLAHRADFVKINEEIQYLGSQLRRLNRSTDSRRICSRRQELYEAKRQLVAVELSLWQSIQPCKISSEANDVQSSVACLPSYFSRVRRLDPPRDRLASSLFLETSLRSAEGQSALCDMITLCKPTPEVAYRPSLHPEKGCCPVLTCGREMDRYVPHLPQAQATIDGKDQLIISTPPTYSIDVTKRWDHIYKCYQEELAKGFGSAELCFQCDKWITGSPQWHEHCQYHLDNYESLPVQLNPLFFRRTLASAGHCIDCMFDSTLPPNKRFQQFLITQSWREHTSAHSKLKREKSELYESKPVPCPDLRCGIHFDSVKDLQYHKQDVHCLDREIDLVRRRRRPKQYFQETQRPPCSDSNSQTKFINKTAETFVSDAANLISQIRQEESLAVENLHTINHYTPSTSAKPSPTLSSMAIWTSDTATDVSEGLYDFSDSDSLDDKEFHPRLLKSTSIFPLHRQAVEEIQLPEISVDVEKEYEIEEIQDQKRIPGRGNYQQYLVKWKGYKKPTWEPRSGLENTEALEVWEKNTGHDLAVPTVQLGKKRRRLGGR